MRDERYLSTILLLVLMRKNIWRRIFRKSVRNYDRATFGVGLRLYLTKISVKGGTTKMKYIPLHSVRMAKTVTELIGLRLFEA